MRSSTKRSSNQPPRRNIRPIDAAAISSAAGTARRGSALVIVVGTLALISVFAAIYISIGQSDRRSAATVTQRADLGVIVDAYADHTAGVIARDRFDTVMQMIDAAGRFQIPRHALTDAPYTDWTLRSEADGADMEWLLFSPFGGNGHAKPTRVPGDDPRVASDPWLASLRPTFLGDSYDPRGVNFARPTSAGDPFRFYLDNRDWYQISNVAPDGRFVNLYNLRSGSLRNGANGGFNAEPGSGVTNLGNNRRVRRMSEGLSLYRLRSPGSESSAIQSFDPVADNAIWLPGVSDPVNPGAALPSSEILNTPAVFTMFQRFAFLPLNQPFVTYNRDGEVSTWADPDFPAYQWADADGDGMADSRWFELTSVREPANANNLREDLTSFYDSSQFRVVAGVRVVDLSAMVNVNTATDGLTPPTRDFPLGMTPGEVDLRRLLTMQDAAREYTFEYQDGGILPLSMQDLHKPLRIARTGVLPGASDYRGYGHFLSALDAPLDPETPGMLVGRYAASGIRRGLDQYAPLGPAFRGREPVDPAPENTLVEGSSFQRLGNPPTASDYNRFGDARANSFVLAGRLDPSRLGSSSLIPYFVQSDLAASAYFSSGSIPSNLYDSDDLAELLAYHGLNDPDKVSRLERNALGRFQGNDLLGAAGAERFSPLMSTRPLTLDRDQHGRVMPGNRLPLLEPTGDIRNLDRVIDGRIAPESMAMFELSPRTVMTTLSGAVPLKPLGVAGIPVATRPRAVPGQTGGLTLEDATITLDAATNSAASAFGVFYGALAGELEVFRPKRRGGMDGPADSILNDIWPADLSISRESPYATLFYGHRGPELAMRVAAHAAVNTVTLFGGDTTQPTIATLVLHNELADSGAYERLARDVNQNSFQLPVGPDRQLAIYYPGLTSTATRFDIDAPRRGDGGGGELPNDRRVLPGASQGPEKPPLARQAVNVIAVEPTPVITEVASFYLYHDAAESAGGDGDFERLNNQTDPVTVPTTEVSIDGSLNPSNSDLLAAVFAVQLHNPFDEDIRLGGSDSTPGAAVPPRDIMWRKRNPDTGSHFDPDNNLIFDYYIEFNGYFFKLGEFWEYTPRGDTPLGFDPGPGGDVATIVANRGTPPAADAPLQPNTPETSEFQYRGVTLGAGETRVFYAMAHPRYDNEGAISSANNGLAQKWFDVLTSYSTTLPSEFTDTTDHDADGDNLADGLDGKGWTGPGQEWIENQFAVDGNRAVRIHPFDPKSGELVLQDTFQDFNSTPGTTVTAISESGGQIQGRVAEANQVRLWRKYVVRSQTDIESEEGTSAGAATRRNIVENDILVDRLYLKAPAALSTPSYLDVGLPSNSIDIAGTVSINEGYDAPVLCTSPAGAILRNDNTGLSISRWASVRRRDLSTDLTAGEDNPIGRIMPWMVQSRLNPQSTWFRSTNKEGQDGAVTDAFNDALTREVFFDLCTAGEQEDLPTTRVGRWPLPKSYDIAYNPRQLLGSSSGSRLGIRSMRESPIEKNTDASFDDGDRFDGQALGDNILPTVPDRLHGSDSPLRPEVVLRKPVDAARVADALLAMGIGPTWAPNLDGGYTYTDGEWMTLPEAFAVALGYEDITLPGTAAAQIDANVVWHDAVREYTDPSGGPARAEYVLDNLHLRLDDYVAFVNVQPPGLAGEIGPDGKPIFSIDPTQPLGANSDFRRGTGAPLALGVLDRLRPFGVLDLAGDLPPASPDTRPLTRAIPGLINVQTAPLRVLRLLPGLTPSIEQYRPDETSGARQSEWWGQTLTETGLFDSANLASSYQEYPDIAAGITAYRDRLAATPRNLSTDLSLPLDQRLIYRPDTNPLFLADNAAWFTRNLQAEQFDPALPFNRAEIAGVPGLRGTPMFGSLGELLMVATDETNPLTTSDQRRHLTMQAYFGGDQQLGVAGSDANAVSIDPKFRSSETGNDPWVGITTDDYAQRLALAAALSNTTTVRSDYFAAWMVLQGFRESDVTGLRPEDPLVPSFKRRYLMVIDRSNVTEPGQAPRIVLFKELPL